MCSQDNHPITNDSDARRFEKEIHAMVPELNRAYKLENAELTNSIIQTTFEEFIILYEVEARFRPGYSESEAIVNIPNLFVKIIADRDTKTHYIKKLIKEDSPGVLRNGFNSPLYLRSYGDIIDFSIFYINGTLDRDALRKSTGYGLASLKSSYQNIWLTKLEFILNNTGTLFTEAFDLTSGQIIETIVRMRPAVIELYNWFDFQGSIPKLIVDDSTKPYDAHEAMRASLALLFLTLCDLDVVVVNDSRGATFENYIQEGFFSCFYPEKAPETTTSTGLSDNLKLPIIVIWTALLVAGFMLYKFIF